MQCRHMIVCSDPPRAARTACIVRGTPNAASWEPTRLDESIAAKLSCVTANPDGTGTMRLHHTQDHIIRTLKYKYKYKYKIYLWHRRSRGEEQFASGAPAGARAHARRGHGPERVNDGLHLPRE